MDKINTELKIIGETVDNKNFQEHSFPCEVYFHEDYNDVVLSVDGSLKDPLISLEELKRIVKHMEYVETLEE